MTADHETTKFLKSTKSVIIWWTKYYKVDRTISQYMRLAKILIHISYYGKLAYNIIMLKGASCVQSL